MARHNRTAHLGLYDTLADWEVGILPVQFACAVLRRLGLASERTLDAYERLFGSGDASAFPVLVDAQAASH